MFELRRDGVAFQLRALGCHRQERRAGSDSSLKIPARFVVRAVSGGLAFARSCSRVARTEMGFHRAGAALSAQGTRTRVQSGGTAGKAVERRDKNSIELEITPACLIYRDPDKTHARATRREHARRICDSQGRKSGRRAD